jgi:hypothetical protein
MQAKPNMIHMSMRWFRQVFAFLAYAFVFFNGVSCCIFTSTIRYSFITQTMGKASWSILFLCLEGSSDPWSPSFQPVLHSQCASLNSYKSGCTNLIALIQSCGGWIISLTLQYRSQILFVHLWVYVVQWQSLFSHLDKTTMIPIACIQIAKLEYKSFHMILQWLWHIIISNCKSCTCSKAYHLLSYVISIQPRKCLYVSYNYLHQVVAYWSFHLRVLALPIYENY